jgi:class 3 adenylate cyclase
MYACAEEDDARVGGALGIENIAAAKMAFVVLVIIFEALSLAATLKWPAQIFLLEIFPFAVALNFGMSHCVNTLSVSENFLMVVMGLAFQANILNPKPQTLNPKLILHPDGRDGIYVPCKHSQKLALFRDYIAKIFALLTLKNFSLQARQLPDLIAEKGGASLFVTCVVVAFVCINLSLSRTVQLNERRTWLRHLLYKCEQQDISAILFDLVPPYYVELLIKSSGIGTTLPVLQCRVVGLQFDIVAFTQLSQSVSPLQLAKTVNALFSEFDRAVLGRGLFKIDTIGDAYIIVGWLDDESVLPQEDEHVASAQTLGAEQHTMLGRDIETCVDLLAVSEDMMRAVAKIREATGVALNARIGISMGTVVAGMQGELQQRFAVRGPAMKSMAMLETTAEVGKVHASADYMNLVSSHASGRALLARWSVASVRLLGDEGESFMLSTKNTKACRRANVVVGHR